MLDYDEEFDLDVRISGMSDWKISGVGAADAAVLLAGDMEQREETIAPEATCPADTCSLGCQTLGTECNTCGCNTVETCNQGLCSDAITFGLYCEDQSDGCGDPQPGTAACADPPD